MNTTAASIIDEDQLNLAANLDELDAKEQSRSMLYDEYKKKMERHRAAIKRKKMEKKKATKRKASSILDRFHLACCLDGGPGLAVLSHGFSIDHSSLPHQ